MINSHSCLIYETETHSEVLRKGVIFLLQKYLVVRKRTHCDSYLGEIVQIVHERILIQLDSVANSIAEQKPSYQVIHIATFSAVRSELKCVQVQTRPQCIQVLDIHPQVKQVINVRRVVVEVPVFWRQRKLLKS